MKIAYFLNFYPTASRVVAEPEILELLRIGHEVYIFSVWGQKDSHSRIPPEFANRTFHIETSLNIGLIVFAAKAIFRAPRKTLRFICLARKYIGFIFALVSLHTANLLQKLNIERIHAHFASTNALRATLLAEFLNIPFSCTGHGSDILLYPLNNLPEIIQRSRPFITISNFNKSYLQKTYGEKARNVKLIHCGVDLSEFKPQNRNSRKIPTILSVTWLRKAKGVKYLIEAIAMLKSKGLKFKCIIAGGGYLYDEIKTMISARNVESVIELKGSLPHDEIIALYMDSDIFVLPSLSEGIPIALMEAMAMELPVVTTRITGIPELVESDHSGFLVEPRNPQGISDSLEILLLNQDLRKQMGVAGRKKVEYDFNLEKNTRLLENSFLRTDKIIQI